MADRWTPACVARTALLTALVVVAFLVGYPLWMVEEYLRRRGARWAEVVGG